MYSVIGDTLAADYENLDLYDTPEEALKEAKDFLKAGDIVTVLEMAESGWQPYICIDSLLEEFQDQAFTEGGEASEPWSDFIAGKAMTAAADELEDELNNVLKRWLENTRSRLAGTKRPAKNTVTALTESTLFVSDIVLPQSAGRRAAASLIFN